MESNMKTTRTELEGMTVKSLRQLAVERGYGLLYLSTKKKSEIIQDILREQERHSTPS
jgi:hypothetical protein